MFRLAAAFVIVGIWAVQAPFPGALAKDEFNRETVELLREAIQNLEGKVVKIPTEEKACLVPGKEATCTRTRCFYNFDTWTTDPVPDITSVQVMVFNRPNAMRIKVSGKKVYLKQMLAYDASGNAQITSGMFDVMKKKFYVMTADLADEKLESVCIKEVDNLSD